MKKQLRPIKFLSRVFQQWKNFTKPDECYIPTYRIVNIEQDANGDYQVSIQLIGKQTVIKSAPEKLLADDKVVNCFSPRDVRTLTYLGYLGINSPKYKILAKTLSKNYDQMLFAVLKKGDKNYKIVTANEISNNEEIIEGLAQKEAHMIGMTTAGEQSILEEKQKEILRKQLKNKDEK
ncbi:MAG: hypothetical protein A3E87_10660 [Gammaproteobacteria bacterium RIFCSPHIGHO2_12_FULL_35_23]|nr:MAG: hypothetical protein A3E87_10660 [Gammaproteobacteria bacterium RIFCSPHIGHO2_12_FULL_35_23]